MIQNDGDLQKCQRANTFDRHPFIEWALPPPLSSGLDLANKMPSPRTLKTHLPVQMLPPSFCRVHLAGVIKSSILRPKILWLPGQP